jgi:hypothetical protein
MHDPVNSPKHYADTCGGIECIEAIEASMSMEEFKGFLKGNVQKYVWRYAQKNGVEDLKKAKWYLERLITVVAMEEALKNTATETINEAVSSYISDPDAYMISGSTSFRQGPPEPLNDNDYWKLYDD